MLTGRKSTGTGTSTSTSSKDGPGRASRVHGNLAQARYPFNMVRRTEQKKSRAVRYVLTGTVPKSTVPDARPEEQTKKNRGHAVRVHGTDADPKKHRHDRCRLTGIAQKRYPTLGVRTGTGERDMGSAATITKKPVIVAGGRKETVFKETVGKETVVKLLAGELWG